MLAVLDGETEQDAKKLRSFFLSGILANLVYALVLWVALVFLLQRSGNEWQRLVLLLSIGGLGPLLSTVIHAHRHESDLGMVSQLKTHPKMIVSTFRLNQEFIFLSLLRPRDYPDSVLDKIAKYPELSHASNCYRHAKEQDIDRNAPDDLLISAYEDVVSNKKVEMMSAIICYLASTAYALEGNREKADEALANGLARGRLLQALTTNGYTHEYLWGDRRKAKKLRDAFLKLVTKLSGKNVDLLSYHQERVEILDAKLKERAKAMS